MKKLTEQQISKIRELARRGLSHRKIAERLKIAPATVFYYTRQVQNEENHIHGKLKEKAAQIMKEQIGREIIPAIYDIDCGKDLGKVPFAFFHLGFTVVCPHCGRELDHLWMCVDCGKIICQGLKEDEGCGEEFSLKTAARKEELASLT